MTNTVKGEVPLKLKDGRTLTLVMDFEAFVAAEALYRQPLAILTIDAARGFVGARRAFLYGALRAHHADIDPEALGPIFADNELAINKALSAADKASYPDASEDKKRGKALASPQRGRNSGRSGAKPVLTPKPSGERRRAPSR